MKKILALLMAVALLATLTACGEKTEPSTDAGTTTTTSADTTTTDAEDSTTTEANTESTTTETVEAESTTQAATQTTTKATTAAAKATTTAAKATTTKAPTTTTTTKPVPAPPYYKEVDNASGWHQSQCFIGEEDQALDYTMVFVKVWMQRNVFESYYDRSSDKYLVPEKVMLETIRTMYVFSDQQFAEMKKQGSYNLGEYENGIFSLMGDLGAGGEPYTSHTVTSYEDDKKGVIKVYFTFDGGGYEEKYVAEFVYTGKSDLKIESRYDAYDEEDGYTWWVFVSDNLQLLNSLRMRSIKKV